MGYSSLGLLQDVPADVLKIDRGFLNRDMADRKNVMIIKGIVNIANILHLKTVCEGVETGAQKELLKGIGCDLAQGYYYAKPMEREKWKRFYSFVKSWLKTQNIFKGKANKKVKNLDKNRRNSYK